MEQLGACRDNKLWWDSRCRDEETDESGGESDGVSDERSEAPRKLMRLSDSITSHELDPNCTPLPAERKTIQEGLGVLKSSSLPSPVKQENCHRLVNELLNSAGVKTSPGKQITPRREARVARAMRDADPWYPNTLAAVVAAARIRDLLPTGSQVVNWDHIEAPDLNGGFHFCPPDHDLRSTLRSIYPNPETGVFFATFDHKGVDKTSTFFPDWISDIPSLKRLLSEGDVVEEQKGNRLLLVGQKEGTPFYVHCYTRQCGFLIASAFPIFFFGDLTPVDKEEIMVLGSLHTRDSLYRLIEDLKPIFSSPISAIYDIATLLGDPNVPRGVYIRVNRLMFQ